MRAKRIIEERERIRERPSPLLTRGLGPDSELVTSGFRTFKLYVIRILKRVGRAGRSRAEQIARRVVDTYKITAEVISLNGSTVLTSATSMVRGMIDRSSQFVINTDRLRVESVRKPSYRIIINEIKVSDGNIEDARDRSDT